MCPKNIRQEVLDANLGTEGGEKWENKGPILRQDPRGKEHAMDSVYIYII
jgi:hypothetical protein